ncbi:hypothetical protein LG288_02550 [Idiomarina seosinensis]|uniref:hypothetical protein n=1 Tax=Idiomarina seosinensis TaxID=281739 RepID=UPI00384DEEC7
MNTANKTLKMQRLWHLLTSKEALLTLAVVLLLAVIDISQRLWPASPDVDARQWDDLSLVELNEKFTSVDTVQQWLEPYQPKPEQVAEETQQPPEKPAPPTPEEQLDKLVEQGAYRIGADVVYLRGVLIEDDEYALLTLVDKSMKPRFKALALNDRLGDYQLTQVTPKGIELRAESDTITMQLFKNNETR